MIQGSRMLRPAAGWDQAGGVKEKSPEGEHSLRTCGGCIYRVAAPYSLVMAFADTTHCLPNLQTSTPFTSLP